eukprot:3792265-Rhodomonas_salina.3
MRLQRHLRATQRGYLGLPVALTQPVPVPHRRSEPSASVSDVHVGIDEEEMDRWLKWVGFPSAVHSGLASGS